MRLVLALVIALAAAAPALAADQPTGWDGTNPFRCTLQNAAFEPTGPDPGADPYCVEFDKRRQNVTELGVVQFLSLEPARVAAATDKCFYFQSDHWRGSVVQSDGSTKTYEWDGHYFFDKARGEGGVWVTNFNFNGQTQDPSAIPGVPQDYARYFGPGTGGVITRNNVESDPSCVERAKREPAQIYNAGAAGSPVPPPATAAGAACGGPVTTRRLGPVSLGQTEAQVRAALGPPAEVRRGFFHYCGGTLRVGFRGDRSGEAGDSPEARVAMLVSTSRSVAPVGRRIPRGARRFGPSLRADKGRTLLVRRGRVTALVLADRRAIRSRLWVGRFVSRALRGG